MKSLIVSATLCVLLLAAACSQSPEKLMTEANKYNANKKYDEASILYQKILVKDKTNAEAYYKLGLNYLEQRKINDAANALRRAVDLKPANTDAVSKLAEIYLMAYGANPKQGKLVEPEIRQLDGKLLQQNPNSYEGLFIQGMIAAVIDHDSAKALTSFAKANQAKPYSRDLIKPYAEILAQSGKTDEAIALLNNMLTHDKTWDDGYNQLLIIYANSNQRDKLEGVLRQHVDADPKSATAIMNYAEYRRQTNDFAGAEQLMQRMTKDTKTFPAAQMMMGDFYARAKKLDEAKAAWEQGKKDDPKNALPYDFKLTQLQEATGHNDEALKMAKDLVEKNPKDVSANYLYADLLLKTNTRDKATKTIEDIKKMVDNIPTYTPLRYELAKAYFESTDREKCLTILQQVIGDAERDQQKTRQGQPALLPAQILSARIYQERGDNAKALELTAPALAANPRSVADAIRLEPTMMIDARILRDRALYSNGVKASLPSTGNGNIDGLHEVQEAQVDLEALTKSFPNLPEAHILLGHVYRTERAFDKATEQYQAAANGPRPDLRAFVGLQLVKLDTGHSAEALQAMQDLVSKNPADANVRLELAMLQTTVAMAKENIGQPAGKQLLQQAEDNYKQIVSTNPSAADSVWMELGIVQSRLGQDDAALASFQQASTLNPKNPDAYMRIALLLEGLNRKKEAVDNYNKALNLTPDNALALNNLAMISADSGGNLDQAQSYAEKARKGAPQSSDIADTLGYVYLQKNLNTQAAEIFRENVERDPKNPAFRFHLAMALLKQGDKQGAKDQANKALQVAPPDLQGKIKAFVGQIG